MIRTSSAGPCISHFFPLFRRPMGEERCRGEGIGDDIVPPGHELDLPPGVLDICVGDVSKIPPEDAFEEAVVSEDGGGVRVGKEVVLALLNGVGHAQGLQFDGAYRESAGETDREPLVTTPIVPSGCFWV